MIALDAFVSEHVAAMWQHSEAQGAQPSEFIAAMHSCWRRTLSAMPEEAASACMAAGNAYLDYLQSGPVV